LLHAYVHGACPGPCCKSTTTLYPQRTIHLFLFSP
jgi:hypothetical protein